MLLSGGSVSQRTTLAFLLFHFFLYGGANAFNSYYDRDAGPIGGLEKPPPVSAGLLPFSLTLQLAGLVLAPLVNVPFTLLYLILFVVFTAYSHPAIRLKRRPWVSLLAIGWGQGGVAFLAGWVSAGATAPDIAGLATARGLWGFLSAVLIVAALYPLSQIYQTGEDRSRGEETLGVVLGRVGALGLTMALFVAGVGALVLAAWDRFGIGWTAVFLAYAAFFLFLLLTSRACLTESPTIPAFRRVMLLNYVNSTAFLAFIVLQLARGSSE